MIHVPVAGGVRAGVLAQGRSVSWAAGGVDVGQHKTLELFPVFLPVHAVRFLFTYVYV